MPKPSFAFLALPFALATFACGSESDDSSDEAAETGESETDESTSTDESSTDPGESSDDPTTSDTGTTDTTTDTTEETTTETGPGDCEPVEIPTNGAELLPWLEGQGYADWPAESGPHESTGPHFGDVRTFVDPCLAASLDAGNAEHPVGSATVKELYGDGDAVLGYSVMVKLEAGAEGDGWYWYEEYQGNVYADEQGAGLCTGCHSGGVDYFLSPWPLQ